MRPASSPPCRRVPRPSRRGARLLLAAAAALLAVTLAPPSAAIGFNPGGGGPPIAIMVDGVSVGKEIEVVGGLVVGAQAQADPSRPLQASAGACVGFDSSSYEPFGVEAGGPIMVFVGFLGPTRGTALPPYVAPPLDGLVETQQDTGSAPEPSMPSVGETDAKPSTEPSTAEGESGTPFWVYFEGSPLPRTAPKELRVPAPPGTSWGTWGAGYSQTGCP